MKPSLWDAACLCVWLCRSQLSAIASLLHSALDACGPGLDRHVSMTRFTHTSGGGGVNRSVNLIIGWAVSGFFWRVLRDEGAVNHVLVRAFEGTKTKT